MDMSNKTHPLLSFAALRQKLPDSPRLGLVHEWA